MFLDDFCEIKMKNNRSHLCLSAWTVYVWFFVVGFYLTSK